MDTSKTLPLLLLATLFAICCAQGNSTSGGDSSGSYSTTGSVITDSTTGFVVTNSTTFNSTACGNNTDCSSCASDLSCIWCQDSLSCQNGQWWGPAETCSDWRWKQCQVDGKYALLGAVGGLLVIVLLLLLCVCCCCCCSRKKYGKKDIKNFKEFKAVQMEESETQGFISKHPKTDERRKQLAQKYSKLNSSYA